MNPTISVIDLANSTVSVRPSDTRTLDIPAGFDRCSAVASLDFHSQVQCASTDGGLLRYAALADQLVNRWHEALHLSDGYSAVCKSSVARVKPETTRDPAVT